MNTRQYTKIRKLLLISLTMLIVSSCGYNTTPDDTDMTTDAAQVESTQEQTNENAVSTEQQNSTVALTSAELNEFTALFGSDEYNGFLTESYNSPEEINWDSVVEFGAGLSAKNVGDDEINDYLEFKGEQELSVELFVIRKSDLEKYIKKHTGLKKVADDILSWNYVQKYDSYYKENWAAYHTHYRCVSGERTGDHYELRFRVNSEDLPGSNAGKNYGKWADRVIQLNKTSDGIVIESNAIQWDDYCDKEQTFDVELAQFDGPIHFVTYSGRPDEADITLVKDNNYLVDLYTSIYTQNGNGYLNKIIAVGIFDFNCDGMDDVVVIGDSNFGKYVMIYQAVSSEYMFESFADLDEDRMSDLGCDFTIASVKKMLLGDNQEGKCNSFQELYAQIARVYNIANDKNEFDLIFSDDDDVPELVVGVTGYWVSLIAYEDGKAHYLMEQWPYGAGGNAGYSYAPRKGVFYNGNADYAGAVYYSTYMSKRDVGELGTDYWVKDINFNDLDGDGWPSDVELNASGEYVGSSEYHNETDKVMTEDEVEAVIDLYDSYDMKQVVGRMDYTTFLDRLAGKEVGITGEQAVEAIKKYCFDKNAHLKDVADSGEYTVYWNVESIDDTDIVVLFRSYTGAQLRYYIDRFSGITYSKEFVPGVSDEGQWTDEYFDVKDYMN